ncbi:MAG: cell division protein ZapB [Candidatus Adiutrix sp.]
MSLAKFETLETKISTLLNKLSSFAQRNNELEESLGILKKELEAAEILISELQEEREIVLSKVDGILARLE